MCTKRIKREQPKMSCEQGSNSQSADKESVELAYNGLIFTNICLPIEIIQRILCYADEKTLLNCQLVCNRWNEIIVDYVWQKKAEIKTSHKFSSDTVLKWKDFYLICAKNLFGRNFVKNHSGTEGFKHWKMIKEHVFSRYDVEHRMPLELENFLNESDEEFIWDDDSDNGKDEEDHFYHNRNYKGGWMIQCPPHGAPPLPPKPEFEKKELCFANTYYDCYKQQVIDLFKEGFSANILDQMQPTIEISEWYCCRVDCPAYYNIRARLLNQSGKKIDKFVFEDFLEGGRQNIWFNVKHEFKNYGQGLRKIRFVHGGRDGRFWAGHYGSKMAGAYVKAKISDGF